MHACGLYVPHWPINIVETNGYFLDLDSFWTYLDIVDKTKKEVIK